MPTYFVQQQWGKRNYLSMVSAIRAHIARVEPGVDVDTVGVWCDLVCTSSDAKEDMQALHSFLLQAKPTLVCVDPGTALASTGKPELQTGHTDANGCTVVLTMHRAKHGIRGFHMFDTCHITYV